MPVTVTKPRPASRSGPGPEHGAIVAEELVKTYPGEVRAVRGISFSVAAGESFGLLGPNGAGKSTTIGMLNTTIRPTSGRALLAGHDVQANPMSARRASSVVFQDPVLDRPLTGRQNLQLHLRLWRVPKADGLARLAELTAATGLAGLLDRPVATYSGGQRRRLEIVRALLSAPRVLFLDEPTAGLDTYIGAVPAVAIVPWFLAGTLYPITALPHWLTYVARVLPLTHALALLRYGLTSDGAAALQNIWGMRSTAAMAALSLAVVCGYAVVATAAAMQIFARSGIQ